MGYITYESHFKIVKRAFEYIFSQEKGSTESDRDVPLVRLNIYVKEQVTRHKTQRIVGGWTGSPHQASQRM